MAKGSRWNFLIILFLTEVTFTSGLQAPYWIFWRRPALGSVGHCSIDLGDPKNLGLALGIF